MRSRGQIAQNILFAFGQKCYVATNGRPRPWWAPNRWGCIIPHPEDDFYKACIKSTPSKKALFSAGLNKAFPECVCFGRSLKRQGL